MIELKLWKEKLEELQRVTQKKMFGGDKSYTDLWKEIGRQFNEDDIVEAFELQKKYGGKDPINLESLTKFCNQALSKRMDKEFEERAKEKRDHDVELLDKKQYTNDPCYRESCAGCPMEGCGIIATVLSEQLDLLREKNITFDQLRITMAERFPGMGWDRPIPKAKMFWTKGEVQRWWENNHDSSGNPCEAKVRDEIY